MKEVSVNKQMMLSQHFSLGELTKTKYVTEDGNIPSHVEIENLIRVCGWLEELRARFNRLYVLAGVRPQSKVDAGVDAGVRPQSKVAGDCTLAPDPKPAGSTLAPGPSKKKLPCSGFGQGSFIGGAIRWVNVMGSADR